MASRLAAGMLRKLPSSLAIRVRSIMSRAM